MGMSLLDLPPRLQYRRTHWVEDDFDTYTSGGLWTSLATGSGASVAINSAGIGGLLTLTTGGTQNNEAAVATTNTDFQILTAQPLVFECRLSALSEANVNNLALAAGLSDQIGTTGFIAAGGATLVTTFSGAVIFLPAGSTTLSVQSSIGSTQTLTVTTTTPVADGNDHLFRVEIRPSGDGGLGVAEVTYWFDNYQLRQATPRGELAIKHYVSYSSAAKMLAGVFIKAGSSSSESVNVDYIVAAQLRGKIGV